MLNIADTEITESEKQRIAQNYKQKRLNGLGALANTPLKDMSLHQIQKELDIIKSNNITRFDLIYYKDMLEKRKTYLLTKGI
jgi:hypothetical protein